jgi:hypothetical protein
MFTFECDDVKPERHYETGSADTPEAIANFFKREAGHASMADVEAYRFNTAKVDLGSLTRNTFIDTAMRAYKSHYPITFGPDEIWLLVSQAIATYIESAPEKARHAIVPFEGKKTLTVVNSDFVKGSPKNPWEREFGKFGDQIASFLGKRRDLFDPTFSTTGPTEKAAIQVRMMTALAPYFNYSMRTLCGVPRITLLGTVEDWKGIATRVHAFKEFTPEWITAPLEYVAIHFVEAAKGNPQMDFWQNFFKTRGGSGGTPVGGLINCLFPYLGGKRKNAQIQGDFQSRFLAPRKGAYDVGPSNDVGDFGTTVGHVPMSWNYYGETIPMRLASGIVGKTFENSSYRCTIGWFVGKDVGEK